MTTQREQATTRLVDLVTEFSFRDFDDNLNFAEIRVDAREFEYAKQWVTGEIDHERFIDEDDGQVINGNLLEQAVRVYLYPCGLAPDGFGVIVYPGVVQELTSAWKRATEAERAEFVHVAAAMSRKNGEA